MKPIRILSNGAFTTLLSHDGVGVSHFRSTLLTGWRADSVEDSDGLAIVVRDLGSGERWCAGRRPGFRPPDAYEARATAGGLELVRRDGGIETSMACCVARDADVELRRVLIHNLSSEPRELELTSYLEPVLAHRNDHASHPAFSKLFLHTEFEPEDHILLARRRPRSSEESHPWLGHALGSAGPKEFETNRPRFLGRNRPLADAVAFGSDAPLSGTTGNVLDPILSFRRRATLQPGQILEVVYHLAAGADREAVLEVLRNLNRVTTQLSFLQADAWATGLLEELGVTAVEADAWQSLAGAILLDDPCLRRDRSALEQSTGWTEELSAIGLAPSGRGRRVVLDLDRVSAEAAREARRTHAYWRRLGLPIELVVVAAKGASPSSAVEDDFCRSVVGVSQSSRRALEADARWVVGAPLLEGEIRVDSPAANEPGPRSPVSSARSVNWAAEALIHENGFGGFTPDGREYVMRLEADASGNLALPPRPWINVIANPDFGCMVSETGSSCTWSLNSREHRLTPWTNDAVLDPSGEALFLRDEASGRFWSAFPGPAAGDGPYEVRHGVGYSRFRHESEGLELDVTVLVPSADPIKVTSLRVTNRSGERRQLSVMSYARLVLGGDAEETARWIVVAEGARPGDGSASNRLVPSDESACSRLTAADRPFVTQLILDRERFLGRSGTWRAPAAVTDPSRWSAHSPSHGDPCFAHRIAFPLEPGETITFQLLLAHGPTAAMPSLLERYSDPKAADRALQSVKDDWSRLIGGTQIETPSPELDLMVNAWLPYQTVGCRLWGRSAHYQSGGAFGFRDQLQDASSLVYLRPEAMRAQIVLHASHQFVEGDVLHWWHPPDSRGLRTRFADDLLWLPLLTAFYVASTGDGAVLAESAPFLRARALEPDEDEVFLKPELSGESGDVYEHCCRAIDRSLAVGAHGLPLFGTGDWNDGMNRVGREGRGESVWMGFFLCCVLDDFLPHSRAREDGARVARYAAHRAKLEQALNAEAWDGEWYRRGYYDDGAPLGSHLSDECKIDALVQAWAVLSQAAPRERAEQAIASVERHLVDEDAELIRLLAPPFENTPHDPGYIKGYGPGVRENGGQYTHGVLWVIRAMAELGQTERAAKLLAMLSPVHQARSKERVAVYQVEPYVVAADVYGVAPHVGHGGWSWYTGSAGWMYRIALESVLGFTLEAGRRIRLAPCVPKDWAEYRIVYRLPGEETVYNIQVAQPANGDGGRGGAAGRVAVRAATLDGAPVAIEDGAALIELAHDGKTHVVRVELGSPERTQ